MLSRWSGRLFLAGGILAGGSVFAADPVSQAVDATVQINRDAKASQQKINQIDDQRQSAVDRYRQVLVQTQQLSAYAQQIEQLVGTQEAQRVALERQLGEADVTGREILPLLARMVDSLEKFVAIDLPFLKQERNERIASLKKVLADSETPLAERYRRVLEAYQIEAEYGRSLGAERSQIGDRQADLLRMGRAGLYYLTLDGDEAGRWDATINQWEVLPGRYRKEIRKGLKIARETATPDFITLPLPVAGGKAS